MPSIGIRVYVAHDGVFTRRAGDAGGEVSPGLVGPPLTSPLQKLHNAFILFPSVTLIPAQSIPATYSRITM